MTCSDPNRLEITTTSSSPAFVCLRMHGVLDASSYRRIRDALVKHALDQPGTVIVDVDDLDVPSDSAWSVFTSARWLVSRWPGVPVALVSRDAAVRQVIVRNGIVRYVPLYTDLATAVAASGPPLGQHIRHRAEATAPTVAVATSFVLHWLRAWSLQRFAVSAKVVATVLINNALANTRRQPVLRLETDGTTVTVAVSDSSPTLASVRTDTTSTDHVNERVFVAALTRVWGNTPVGTGKVVWAVIGPENCL